MHCDGDAVRNRFNRELAPLLCPREGEGGMEILQRAMRRFRKLTETSASLGFCASLDSPCSGSLTRVRVEGNISLAAPTG